MKSGWVLCSLSGSTKITRSCTMFQVSTHLGKCGWQARPFQQFHFGNSIPFEKVSSSIRRMKTKFKNLKGFHETEFSIQTNNWITQYVWPVLGLIHDFVCTHLLEHLVCWYTTVRNVSNRKKKKKVNLIVLQSFTIKDLSGKIRMTFLFTRERKCYSWSCNVLMSQVSCNSIEWNNCI